MQLIATKNILVTNTNTQKDEFLIQRSQHLKNHEKKMQQKGGKKKNRKYKIEEIQHPANYNSLNSRKTIKKDVVLSHLSSVNIMRV